MDRIHLRTFVDMVKKSIDSTKTDEFVDDLGYIPKLYTPIQCRQVIAKLIVENGKIDDISVVCTRLHIDPETIEDKQLRDTFVLAINSLLFDVQKINEYRRISDPINEVTFQKWFPDCHLKLPLSWLRVERDYIYNSYGLRILINRYLRPKEPIQYCMLRIARLLFSTDWVDFTKDIQYDGWFMFYTMISCGFMHTSSVLTDADMADPTIISGEACRLMVATKNYGREFIKQMEKISTIISLGVGVGLAVSTIPVNGTKENGTIHGGFRNVVKKLDACNELSIYERKPKIALYLSIHNDTIFDALDLRMPTKEHIENVFFGVMINDYYMYCLRNKLNWYLFPGNAKLDGKYLSDYSGDEYAVMYRKFVDAKLYTREIAATELMDKLLNSLVESGSPYVVWDDVVNRYSNHMHLGKIQTLNLCAEITNYASSTETSSCTLISLNYAMVLDFLNIQDAFYTYLCSTDPIFNDLYHNKLKMNEPSTGLYVDQMKFSYMLGYMGTLALNMFMGRKRNNRELGISPMGVYDMAILTNAEPENLIGPISDAMYLGAIQSSCNYSRDNNVTCNRYYGSPFSYGRPQWMLRNKDTYIKWPEMVFWNMYFGMANSMLTAQAPTATTSMLCGITESVTLPLSILTSKESENGRNAVITYGILNHIICNPNIKFNLKNDIDRQVAMYSKSAPFIDQSQSTMFTIDLTKQNVFNLLKATYLAELKTSIYYILPKLLAPTLEIIRPTTRFTEHYMQKNKSTSSVFETPPKSPVESMGIVNNPTLNIDNLQIDDKNETNDENIITTAAAMTAIDRRQQFGKNKYYKITSTLSNENFDNLIDDYSDEYYYTHNYDNDDDDDDDEFEKGDRVMVKNENIPNNIKNQCNNNTPTSTKTTNNNNKRTRFPSCDTCAL